MAVDVKVKSKKKRKKIKVDPEVVRFMGFSLIVDGEVFKITTVIVLKKKKDEYSMGFSICSPKDSFSRYEGQKAALKKYAKAPTHIDLKPDKHNLYSKEISAMAKTKTYMRLKIMKNRIKFLKDKNFHVDDLK